MLMEGEFQDQGKLDKDLEEWLSPRGSQYVYVFLFELENQDYIRIEESDPE